MPKIAPDWMVALDENLDLDWEVEGEEWRHHVSQALLRIPGTGSHLLSRDGQFDLGEGHIEFSVAGQALRSRLALVPAVAPSRAFVIGQGEQLDDQVEPWTQAVQVATAAVGRTHKEFEWHAVAAPRSSLGPISVDLVLRASGSIGGLRVIPGGVRHYETVKQTPPSFFSRGFRSSMPVVVENSARGYEWQVANRAALIDLHRLCALLSVLWGVEWDLLDGPQPGRRGAAPVPEHSPWDPGAGKHAELVNKTQMKSIPEPTLVELPDWADDAWAHASRDKETGRALSAFYQGLQLVDRHPSYALVAFVGAIEGMGEINVKPERCEKCHQIGGARKRFAKALGSVLSETESEALSKQIYEVRSSTAHTGLLHGAEQLLGARSAFGFFGQPPEADFAWHVVGRMRSLCREVLLHRLKSPLKQGAPR